MVHTEELLHELIQLHNKARSQTTTRNSHRVFHHTVGGGRSESLSESFPCAPYTRPTPHTQVGENRLGFGSVSVPRTGREAGPRPAPARRALAQIGHRATVFNGSPRVHQARHLAGARSVTRSRALSTRCRPFGQGQQPSALFPLAPPTRIRRLQYVAQSKWRSCFAIRFLPRRPPPLSHAHWSFVSSYALWSLRPSPLIAAHSGGHSGFQLHRLDSTPARCRQRLTRTLPQTCTAPPWLATKAAHRADGIPLRPAPHARSLSFFRVGVSPAPP